MKKLYALLPTLAALVVPGKASAQMMPDSTVQIIAYWEVGDQVAVVFSFFPVDHCQPATSTHPRGVGGLSRYSSELIPLSAMMPSGMISTTSQSGEMYRSFCSVTILRL